MLRTRRAKGWWVAAAVGACLALAPAAALAADEPVGKTAEDHFREGVDHLGESRWDEAVAAFQRCVEAKPDLKECWFNLGLGWGKKRDVKNEVRAYEKAVELAPAYVKAHFNLAVALEDMGRADEALRHYERVIALDPTAQDAALNRAMLLLKAKRLEDAVKAFKVAVSIRPENAEAHFDLAVALELRAAELPEPERTTGMRAAVSTYRKAAALDATHVRALYNIGLVHHRLGETAQEITAYRQVLKVRPDYAPALYNLGFALYDAGDARGAADAVGAYLRVVGERDTERRFVAAARRLLKRMGLTAPPKVDGPAATGDAPADGAGPEPADDGAAEPAQPSP